MPSSTHPPARLPSRCFLSIDSTVDGLLVVDKPIGPSSHDVVAVARRAIGTRRVGHTGTLDPRAAGVLPLVLGQATRLAQYLSGSDKEYEAVVRFGLTTDTYDAAGMVIEQTAAVPSRERLADALAQFLGTYEQTPPAYSAKMIAGHRAYVHARAGRDVMAPPVTVTVHRLELLAYTPPLAHLLVRCSAGFYVRSLAHDLGQAVGTGAMLDALTRTEAAGIRRTEALSLETLVGAPREVVRTYVRPLHTLLADKPSVVVNAEGEAWIRHGRDVGPRQLLSALDDRAPLVRLVSADGRLLGLAEPSGTAGLLHPGLVFSYN